jgi:hypothetical protein
VLGRYNVVDGGACPRFHIIICTISIFLLLILAVLSTLLTFVFSSMFAGCFLSPTLRFFYLLELGRRLQCRGRAAQVLRLFLPPVFTSYFTCITSFDVVLCYTPFPDPDNSPNIPRVFLYFGLRPFSYVLLISTCSPPLPRLYVFRFTTAISMGVVYRNTGIRDPIYHPCDLLRVPSGCYQCSVFVFLGFFVSRARNYVRPFILYETLIYYAHQGSQSGPPSVFLRSYYQTSVWVLRR